MTAQKISGRLWLSCRIGEGPVISGCFLPVFFYAINEPKSVLARDLGDCRDNLRNSQSVFLIVVVINLSGKHILRIKECEGYGGGQT